MGHKILDKSKHDNKELVELREKLSQLQIMLASYLPRASNPPNIKVNYFISVYTYLNK